MPVRELVERVRDLLRFAGGELVATTEAPSSRVRESLVVEIWEVAGRRLSLMDGPRPAVLRDDIAGWLCGGLVDEVASWLDGETAPRRKPRSFAEASPEDLGW